jgi:hypothetical protein
VKKAVLLTGLILFGCSSNTGQPPHDGAAPGGDGPAQDGASHDGGVTRDTGHRNDGTGTSDMPVGPGQDAPGGQDGPGGSDVPGNVTPDAPGGDGGGADAVSQLSCTNPSHVLPLNPSNPQDGITLSGYYVDTDTWNAANYPVQQTMYICDYNNWYVVANMNNDSGDGAVKVYPNVHKDFNEPRLDSFTSITSTFSHIAPHVGIYEYAYDMWLNGVASSGSTEVMIWTDNFGQTPAGQVADTVTFDGHTYDVYNSNNNFISFVDKTNGTTVTSGTVSLLQFFNYVVSMGWAHSGSTLGAIDYGIEIVSTDGMDATFQVNDFSVTAN